ncbi:transposase [Bosea sp. NBC_00550]|uniref:transposase n=1 Tax=Bosea sp. NBC_00550 TaxID=2969621 RepID=UPI003FA46E2B
MRIFGVVLPLRPCRGAFDAAVRETIETDPALSHALLPMLAGDLLETFIELDRQVKRAAREDTICRRFMTVPGVGEITALSFKAAVDDPARFKNSRTVGAHFGLTPRRFQSGETDNTGRISHAGDATSARRSRCRKRHADALDRLVEPQGLGCAVDEDEGPPARHRGGRAQDCGRAPSHVGRRYRLPPRIGGCSMT